MSNVLKDILRQSYNNHASEREESDMESWKINIRSEFLQLILNEKKSTILDIGAGTGKDSEFFQKNDINVIAVDLSEEMIKICREKSIESYELDFHNLRKIGKNFDAVWAMNSLLHVEKLNINLVLEEIKSILKPSGLFFMGVYGGEDFEGIWEKDIYNPPRFFSFYTDDNIQRVVSSYFDIINFQKIETGGKYYFQSLIMRRK